MAGAGADLDVGPLPHLLHLVGGAAGYFGGDDLGSQVTGALDAAEGATGFAADVGGLVSQAPVSAAVARLGMTSILLGVAGMTWAIMTSGGAAIQKGWDEQFRAGHREGVLFGLGAGIVGLSLAQAARAQEIGFALDGIAPGLGWRVQIAICRASTTSSERIWSAIDHPKTLWVKTSRTAAQ